MTQRSRFPFLVASFLLLSGVARGEEIRALSGTYTDETVKDIKKEGDKLSVVTDKRTLPLESVKSVRFDDRAVPEGGQVKVHLISHDWLRGTIVSGGGNSFKFNVASLGVVEIEIGNVQGMLFDAPAEKERELESKRLATAVEDDTVYLKAGGKPDGIIEEINEKGVTIDTAAKKKQAIGKVVLTMDKIEALVTTKEGQNKYTPTGALAVRARLGCGSVVEGEVESFSGGELKLKHPLLKDLKVKQKDLLELSVVNGAFVYLSDLDPANVVEKFPPEFDRPADIWGWKRDKEVLRGGRLRLGGRTYDKGLGVHSYCELEFKLNGAYSEFRAVAGLDDSTRYLGQPNLGGAVFRVLVDGKPAKEVGGEAGLKKQKGDAPSEIAVDVAGAKTLTLIADYNFMHVLGRADWADAYLVKGKGGAKGKGE